LNLDETDNRPSLTTVIETAEWYAPSKDRGAQIVAEVVAATQLWRQDAVRAGISRADIELTAAAFAETDGYSAHLSPVYSQPEPEKAESSEPSIDEIQAKGAANWSKRQRHRNVKSPSPADEVNNSIRSDEPTKELGNSVDDDLEL